MPTENAESEIVETPKGSSFSVRFRVLLGLVAVMSIFSFLTIYSIILHKRTVEKVATIKSAYLPLIQGTSDIIANQVVFNIFMDRLVDDPNQSVTREWIDAARRFRPSTLEELVTQINQTLNMTLPDEEAMFLKEMRNRLTEVGRRYRANEARFQGLYDLMDTGRVDDARKRIESLKRAERYLKNALSGIGSDIGLHIKDITEEAEFDGTRATWGLAFLTFLGLLITATLIISTNTLLIPLKRLQVAVARVAMGDLNQQIDVDRVDEIGLLASGFNRMTEALKERDQMLIRSERLATAGKMAAKVTHEIRNPLSSLGLNAELLEEELSELNDNSEAKNLLKAMQDEIERLTQITESYLRYARLPAPEPEFGDLNKVIQATLDFMSEEIRSKGITLHVSYADDLDREFFDHGQIRQALSNLIRNAIEAMPAGGELRIATKGGDEMLEISVQDTGVGVPEEAVNHIFKSFFSTKSDGTGLGLPLVRQICIGHGGDAQLTKTGSTGSTFVLSLPRTTQTE
jgi:two-component system, NtrC family, sensor kinase